MIGYEDYSALGLPPEYEVQERIERMEKHVLEKLKASGLGILANKLVDTDLWIEVIDAMIETERV